MTTENVTKTDANGVQYKEQYTKNNDGSLTPTGGGGGGSGGGSGGDITGPLGQTTAANSVAVVLASDKVVGISASSLPLPTGAATAANQPALNGDGGAPAHVTNFPTTQPVSAASLPLPTGAATSANQNVTAAGTSATSAQGVQGVTGGVAMPVAVSSLPLPAGGATSANQNVTAAGTSATNAQGIQGVTGGVPLPILVSSTYTSTDKSGTITAGGTAQNAIASNANRKHWVISNNSSATMYINDTGVAATAANGVICSPGQVADDGGACSTAAISIFCAVTGAAFASKEYT